MHDQASAVSCYDLCMQPVFKKLDVSPNHVNTISGLSSG